jgi:hypothetical protein
MYGHYGQQPGAVMDPPDTFGYQSHSPSGVYVGDFDDDGITFRAAETVQPQAPYHQPYPPQQATPGPHQQPPMHQPDWQAAYHAYQQTPHTPPPAPTYDFGLLLSDIMRVGRQLRDSWQRVLATGDQILATQMAQMLETLDSVRQWLESQMQPQPQPAGGPAPRWS